MRRNDVAIRMTIAMLGLAAACSGDAGSITAPNESAIHPGFDIGVYPGDAAVRTWSTASPYEWMGYYLVAPCHTNGSFSGKRLTIAQAGLGVAVIYVGQQTWDGLPDRAPWSGPTLESLQLATCSRTLLSAAQGTTEANDAIARAAAEGFPTGTVIFLDLEPMTITQAMRDYYTAWAARVTADGRYRPGIYAHTTNAAAIHADVGSVPFWIASTRSFSLKSPPSAVGHSFATAWQGALDVSRTWGGVTLNVDESVADRKSPSGP